MPPKKGKQSGLAAPARPGPDWSWVGSEVRSPKEITEEHRRRALGLTSGKVCVVPCLERWRARRSAEVQGDKGEEEEEERVEVFEVDDDESDAGEVDTPTGSKRKRQRKAKVETVKRSKMNHPNTKKCVKKSCASNVFCYNHLGLDEWFAPNAEAAYKQANGLGADPSDEMRGPDTLVGLRNLGATCYANAFLQIWFANEAMRSAVYRCAAGLPSSAAQSPIYQLALTFAAMQYSIKSFHDPTGLVESLQLNKGDQQDASEFSKLFMSLVGDEFEKSEDEALKSVIDDEFGGKLKYTTRCLSCGNVSARTEKFLELEISLNSTKSQLEDRLAALFAEERLDGDNRYLCGRCESLQPAVRQASLESLPPTLQVSVLRFVYDPATFNRKKSKTALRFPAQLSMARYGVKDVTYTLQGVVEHLGPSAHRGHFTCKVHNNDTNNWYLCDDGSCKRIKPLTQASEYEASDVVSVASNSDREQSASATKKNGRPRVSAESGDSCVIVSGKSKAAIAQHSSTNVYMLVYRRDDVRSNPHAAAARPSQDIQERIQATNTAVNSEQADHKRRETALKEAFEADVRALVQAFVDIPLDAAKDRQSGLTCIGTEDLTVMLHLNKGKTARPIEAARLAANSASDAHKEPSKTADNGGEVPPIANGHNHVNGHDSSMNEAEPVKHEHTQQDLECQASGKQDSSRTASPEGAESDKRKTVCCPHGSLDPRAGEHMRLISLVALDTLRAVGFVVPNRTQRIDQLCNSCLEENVTKKLSDDEHKETVEKIMSMLRAVDEDECDHVLARSWWQEWKQGQDASSPSADELDHMLKSISCPHQKVLPKGLWTEECLPVPTKAVQLLRQSASGLAIPLRSLMEDACNDCATEADERIGDLSHMKAQAAEEQRHIRGLRVLRGRSDRLPDLQYGAEHNIVDALFVEQWHAFIEDPRRNRRPTLSNARLVCEHGLLNLDPNFNPDWRTDQVRVIEPGSWKDLTTLYGKPDHTITYTRVSEMFARASLPTCKPCWSARRTALADYQITVVLLKTDDPTSGPPVCEVVDRVEDVPQSSARGMRSSDRIRGKRQNGKETRRTLQVDVRRDETVKALREKVGKRLNIPPFYLSLFFKGQDVGDLDRTMGDVGVCLGDTLHVRNMVAEDAVDVEDVEDVEPVPKRGQNGVDGFGGTLLGRSGAVAQGDQSAAKKTPELSVEEVQAAEGMHCMQCTFISPASAKVCAVCESPFA